MYFMALATDYDGTIARDGAVSEKTLDALARLKATGRKLILVTGRELPELRRVFPALDMFDAAVAENGALLYLPGTGEERLLAPPAPEGLVDALRKRGVRPLSVGRAIVATREPHQKASLEVIRELGLELDIVFNKGAVMILPAGVNKASGLDAALAAMGLCPQNVVGIGDAENDHAFLRACGCGVAAANALPAVKETADLVTRGKRGKGVAEMVDRLIARDDRLVRPRRLAVSLGGGKDEGKGLLRPSDFVLIAGSSGIGKSTLATALSERFTERGDQFCVFDPEGDYEGLVGTVSVGEPSTPPSAEQALELLERPQNSIVLHALGVELDKRPEFFASIVPRLTALRARVGRPHWIIADEAHHLMPKARDGASLAMAQRLPGAVIITVHPDAVSADVLKHVTVVVALGPEAHKVVKTFCKIASAKAPDPLKPPKGERVLFWRVGSKRARAIEAQEPRQERKRHTRKYAEGAINEEGSFYFRGPDKAMKLRAQNLLIFLQIAEGVDDATWEFHLKRHDYSTWFREQIRDKKLAKEVRSVEDNEGLSAADSRRLVAEFVHKRYTGPATAS